MQELLTIFPLCRNESQDKSSLGKVWKAQKGSKGSLEFSMRVPQGVEARQPRLWTSTGSLQGFLQEVRKFHRKFRTSTGSSELLPEVLLFLQEALKPGFKQWESWERLHGWLGGW